MVLHYEYAGYLRYDKDEERGKDNSDDSDNEDSSIFNDNDFSRKKDTVRLIEGEFTPIETKDPSFRVKGRFHFTEPWWRICINVKAEKKDRKVAMLDGYFRYGLRDDAASAGQNLAMLFLRKCNVGDEEMAIFARYLRSRLEMNSLSFDNLETRVKNMMTSQQPEHQAAAKQISRHVSVSEEAYYVRTAKLFPLVYQLGPKLFTTKFRQVLTALSGDGCEDWVKDEHGSQCCNEEVDQPEMDRQHLHEADEPESENLQIKLWRCFTRAMEETPWVLGFYKIMTSQFDMKAEAELIPLIETGLFEKMDSLHKDALLIYSVLKYAAWRIGHTYVHVRELRAHPALARSHIKAHAYITNMAEALDWLVSQRIIVRIQCGSEDRVSLALLYGYEKTIADGLARLVTNHKNCPLEFHVNFKSPEFDNIRSDEDQLKAVRAICQEPVVLLSGKGGCGKTATVSTLLTYVKLTGVLNRDGNLADQSCDGNASLGGLVNETMAYTEPDSFLKLMQSQREEDFDSLTDWSNQGPTSQLQLDQKNEQTNLFRDQHEEPTILLAAPTGKAASVLRKRSNLSAQTLHHVALTFTVDKEWRYRRVRVLVVDEGSMVPISVFSKVLDHLLRHAHLQKIIILGDVLQLPSVEAGNFLCDVFPCFARYGVSLVLTTNHRASSALIVENASRVQRGLTPIFDDERMFRMVEIPKQGGKFCNAGKKENDLDWRIDNVIKPLIRNEPALTNPSNSHFITFTKNRVKQLNEICCRHYNNHVTHDDHKQLVFITNDKVVVTQNSTVHVNVKQNGPEPADGEKVKVKYKTETMKLYNGEIFFLNTPKEMCPDKSFNHTLYGPQTGERYLIDIDQVRRNAKLKHGYVTTIHKFQGSESDTIAYLIHGGQYETWQHVYTAITRAKKHVYIICTQESLRRALRNQPIKRQTNLKDLLTTQLGKVFSKNNDVLETGSVVSSNSMAGDLIKQNITVNSLFDSSEWPDESVVDILDQLQVEAEPICQLGGNQNVSEHEHLDGAFTPRRPALGKSNNSGGNISHQPVNLVRECGFGEDILDSTDQNLNVDESTFTKSAVSENDEMKIDDFDSRIDFKNDIEDYTPLKPIEARIEEFTPDMKLQQKAIVNLKRQNKFKFQRQKTIAVKLPAVKSTVRDQYFASLNSGADTSLLEELGTSCDMFAVAMETDDQQVHDLKETSPCADFALSRKRAPRFTSTPTSTGAKQARGDKMVVRTEQTTEAKPDETGFTNLRSPIKMAAYDGNCGLCNTPIKKGVDMLSVLDTKPSPKLSKWVHQQCPKKSPVTQSQ